MTITTRKKSKRNEEGAAMKWSERASGIAKGLLMVLGLISPSPLLGQSQKPNNVILMTDDTGWGDFDAYLHPGRASFMTGRIPIRSALSVVTVPGDANFLRSETPTIAEFFKKNRYTTYFWGKWHLGGKPEA
jgi:Sulfatase